ncbi:MaoC/PaaZ C-terminal domain-containing protein [Pollutimonas bauzanensis]|uniref:N-terminal half of MaoC dehydratase n=1 Tax=Pollutimonas bauzanensis TaxID=658167 RepID=A0A1M5UMP1_9BURK|nr:MaoC/PaaZ C-terminal domain-containing protein [Pollutimonas bauzanensis]SHH64211.1 N-terminal half of MaoC dehydratase [Pollutimonas bauzanensis]
MALDYHALKHWKFEDQITAYSARDSILYALSLGYGTDPLDARELAFVFERDHKVLPTLLTVLGAPGAWATDPRTGITWQRILHGEHRIEVHGIIKPEGILRSRTRISRVVDKGSEKGALVVTERQVSDEADGTLLATIEHTSFCRADGGLAHSDEAPPPLPPSPETPADQHVEQKTRPSSALLYRLNGDFNPIHADPGMAREVGFEKPILHGLCLYGLAAKALIESCCDYRPERLSGLALRFAAPFFPGETLLIKLWRHGEKISFCGFSVERNVAVITHGNATIKDTR